MSTDETKKSASAKPSTPGTPPIEDIADTADELTAMLSTLSTTNVNTKTQSGPDLAKLQSQFANAKDTMREINGIKQLVKENNETLSHDLKMLHKNMAALEKRMKVQEATVVRLGQLLVELIQTHNKEK